MEVNIAGGRVGCYFLGGLPEQRECRGKVVGKILQRCFNGLHPKRPSYMDLLRILQYENQVVPFFKHGLARGKEQVLTAAHMETFPENHQTFPHNVLVEWPMCGRFVRWFQGAVPTWKEQSPSQVVPDAFLVLDSFKSRGLDG